MRIAVFGGTFDPPHNGHIAIAESILSGSYAEKILFVPAYIPPHKQDNEKSSFETRLAMLKLACADKSGFQISALEAERQGPSYTIDTMRELSLKNPNDKFILLIGADSLLNLHTWYQAEELLREFEILAYPRNGSDCDFTVLKNLWPPDIAEKLKQSIVKTAVFNISSTEVREAVSSGRTLSKLVCPSVEKYIKENNLYKNNGVN